MTKPIPPHLKKKPGRPRLSADELARRAELKKKKTPAPVVSEAKPVEAVAAPVAPLPTDFPPPLPIIPGAVPNSPGAPTAVGVSPTLGDIELKSALAKTFTGSMKGLVRALNLTLAKTKFEIDPIEIEADEAGLWAEFASPVFKQYFPTFQDDPKVALLVVTGLILAGKITVRKRNIPYDTGTQEPAAPVAA